MLLATEIDADGSMYEVRATPDGKVHHPKFKQPQQYHLKYDRFGATFYHGLNDQPFNYILPPPHEHVLLRGPSIVMLGVSPEDVNTAAAKHLGAVTGMAQHLKTALAMPVSSGSKAAASKMASKRHHSVIHKALMRRRTSGTRGGSTGDAGAVAVQAPDVAVADEEEGVEEEEEDVVVEEEDEEEPELEDDNYEEEAADEDFEDENNPPEAEDDEEIAAEDME